MISRGKTKSNDDNLTVIGMSHFLPMLICLAIGIVISILAFVSEKVVTRLCNRKLITTIDVEKTSLDLSYWSKRENIYS